MATRDTAQSAEGQIVRVCWTEGDSKDTTYEMYGRCRLRGDDLIVESSWSLDPRTYTIPLADVTHLAVLPDVGAVPDKDGLVSPHAAWETFQFVMIAAIRAGCRVRPAGRDDEVFVTSRLGFTARLGFQQPMDMADVLRTHTTWEGDRSWVNLAGMSLAEAADIVINRDPADLPSINEADRLYPPES